MPVPTTFAALSETQSSNSPLGSEIVGPNMNQYIQQAYAFIRMLYDGQLLPLAAMNFNGQKLTGLANGVANSDAATVGQVNTAIGASVANYVPLAGGVSITGTLAINNKLTLNATSADQGTLTINGNSDTAYGASIALLGNGTTTANKYIRAFSGAFQIVNNAYTQPILSLDDAGNLTVTGVLSGTNVTGSSDERLKEDWRPMPKGFIEKLAAVKRGTFKRKGQRKREVGVSAQSLRKFMREAVFVGKDGMLRVAYGNAALVATAELAEEVLRLRERVAELESR